MVEPHLNERRMVLIGKTGNGKSKTGNTILGEKVFKYGSQAKSITETCQLQDALRFGRQINLVDTPGLFDNRVSNEKVQREIKRCIGLTSPGPHAIILCVTISRFTEEDVETVKHFCAHFGEDLMKYVIVLFTGYDNWKRDQEENSQDPNFQGFIDNLTPYLKNFLQECRNRYIPFDNTLKEKEAEKQVEELLNMVENTVAKNGNSCYTNKDYEKAETELQKKILEKKQEKEKEILKLKVKLETNIDANLRKEYEGKINKLKAELARVRQDTQNSESWLTFFQDIGLSLWEGVVNLGVLPPHLIRPNVKFLK